MIYIFCDRLNICDGILGLLCEYTDFFGYDCKAFSGLPGTCGFNGGIQCEQICLTGDCKNGICKYTDLFYNLGVFKRFFEALPDFREHLLYFHTVCNGLVFGLGGTLMDFFRFCCSILRTNGDFTGRFFNLLCHTVDLFRRSSCFLCAGSKLFCGGRDIFNFPIQIEYMTVDRFYDCIDIGSFNFYLGKQALHGFPHFFQFICKLSKVIFAFEHRLLHFSGEVSDSNDIKLIFDLL